MYLTIILLQHKSGNAEERPNACCSLYGEAAGFESAVFHFTGKSRADKPREFEGRALKALRCEPVSEEYHDLAVRHCPVPRRLSPLFCDLPG
jgi:hypothetical protein